MNPKAPDKRCCICNGFIYSGTGGYWDAKRKIGIHLSCLEQRQGVIIESKRPCSFHGKLPC